MCLWLNSNFSDLPTPVMHTADVDLLCFKMVIDKGDGWVTPFRYSKVEFNKPITSDLNLKNYVEYFVIEEGLHSLVNMANAKELMRIFSDTLAPNGIPFRLVQCLIPKGSKYYRGRFEGYEGIASDTIIYKEFLP